MDKPYLIGQPVWFASTVQSKEPIPCPDCKETGKWKVITPAGDEWEHDCLRCGGSGKLSAASASPVVRQLTIGQVRTVQDADGTKHEYMCNETGVGGGSVYRHDQLFVTKQEAEQVASLLVEERRKELSEKPYEKRFRELSKYRLKDVKVKEAEDRAYAAEARAERLLHRLLELDEYPVWKPEAFGEEGKTGSISLTREQVRGVKRAILWLCGKKDIDALLDYEAEEG
jgi:hypothetical protein